MTKEEQVRVWKHTLKRGIPQGPKEPQQLQETKIGVHLMYFETEKALEGSNSRMLQTSVIAVSYHLKNWEAG